MLLAILFAIRMGVPGVALAVLLTGGATAVLHGYLATAALEFSLLAFFRATAMPLLAPLILSGIALAALRRFHYPQSYPAVILFALLGLFVYLAAVLALVPGYRKGRELRGAAIGAWRKLAG